MTKAFNMRLKRTDARDGHRLPGSIPVKEAAGFARCGDKTQPFHAGRCKARG